MRLHAEMKAFTHQDECIYMQRQTCLRDVQVSCIALL